MIEEVIEQILRHARRTHVGRTKAAMPVVRDGEVAAYRIELAASPPSAITEADLAWFRGPIRG